MSNDVDRQTGSADEDEQQDEDDYASLDSEQSHREADTMYAVFVIADLPIELVNELLEEAAYRGDDTDLRIITTTNTTDLQSITSPSGAPLAAFKSPFLDWTPAAVYRWWAAHIQTRDQSAKSVWAYFNFIIIDAASLPSTDDAAPTLLLCCDAPDFGEAADEVKLKTLRTDFEDGLDYVLAFEMLSMCPSEKESEFAMSIQPPPIYMATGEEGLFKLAPPEVARSNKRAVILQVEAAGRDAGEDVEQRVEF